MIKTLNVGLFNLEFGREPAKVMIEVMSAIRRNSLDVLVVDEAKDYTRVLDSIPGFTYYVDRTSGSSRQVGILVADDLKVKRPTFRQFGNGWRTITGQHHGAPAFPRLTVEWLRIAGGHWPPTSAWIHGVLHAPDERKDDIIAQAKGSSRFLRILWPKHRLLVADFNEPPTTRGKYSPNWVMQQSHAVLIRPQSSAGHGHIDYGLGKYVSWDRVYKDLQLKEDSDHELVVIKGLRPL